jgi:hypothetical protein
MAGSRAIWQAELGPFLDHVLPAADAAHRLAHRRIATVNLEDYLAAIREKSSC